MVAVVSRWLERKGVGGWRVARFRKEEEERRGSGDV
jgi:hypothetical protein